MLKTTFLTATITLCIGDIASAEEFVLECSLNNSDNIHRSKERLEIKDVGVTVTVIEGIQTPSDFYTNKPTDTGSRYFRKTQSDIVFGAFTGNYHFENVIDRKTGAYTSIAAGNPPFTGTCVRANTDATPNKF